MGEPDKRDDFVGDHWVREVIMDLTDRVARLESNLVSMQAALATTVQQQKEPAQ